MLPVVVSYYTKGSLYEKEAQDLVNSCKSLQLEYDIEAINDLGSWSNNCCYKPTFLLKKLSQYRYPIVWTDVDSVIVQNPDLFEGLSADFAAHIRENLPNDDIAKVLSGTLYINYTSKAKRLLKMWILECNKLKNAQELPLDQDALRSVIYNYPHGADVYHLPSSYCKIFDKDDEPLSEEAVFVHYQASRFHAGATEDFAAQQQLLRQLDSLELKEFRRSSNDNFFST